MLQAGGPTPACPGRCHGREEVVGRGEVDGLVGHLGEVVEPGLARPAGGNHGGRSPGLPQFGDEGVQEVPWGVAPVVLRCPRGVGEAQAVHRLGRAVPPPCIVTRQLAVFARGKAVHRVGSPNLVEVGEEAWVQLPVVPVQLPAQTVCPNVGGSPDVQGSDPNVVGVEEVEELPQLGHHGRRS